MNEKNSSRNASAIESNNPLDILTECHRAQQGFCDFLESSADDLPGIPPLDQLNSAIDLLRLDLPLHHLDESKGLFPLIVKYVDNDSEIKASVCRLNQEHDEDEGFAGEIIDLLETLVTRDIQPDAVSAAGYMLRGFFETTRRHIAFEDEVILPFARKSLTSKDLSKLTKVMADNRHTTPRRLFTFGTCNQAKTLGRRSAMKLFLSNK